MPKLLIFIGICAIVVGVGDARTATERKSNCQIIGSEECSGGLCKITISPLPNTTGPTLLTLTYQSTLRKIHLQDIAQSEIKCWIHDEKYDIQRFGKGSHPPLGQAISYTRTLDGRGRMSIQLRQKGNLLDIYIGEPGKTPRYRVNDENAMNLSKTQMIEAGERIVALTVCYGDITPYPIDSQTADDDSLMADDVIDLSGQTVTLSITAKGAPFIGVEWRDPDGKVLSGSVEEYDDANAEHRITSTLAVIPTKDGQIVAKVFNKNSPEYNFEKTYTVVGPTDATAVDPTPVPKEPVAESKANTLEIGLGILGAVVILGLLVVIGLAVRQYISNSTPIFIKECHDEELGRGYTPVDITLNGIDETESGRTGEIERVYRDDVRGWGDIPVYITPYRIDGIESGRTGASPAEPNPSVSTPLMDGQPGTVRNLIDRFWHEEIQPAQDPGSDKDQPCGIAPSISLNTMDTHALRT